jgi:hypothetical protein
VGLQWATADPLHPILGAPHTGSAPCSGPVAWNKFYFSCTVSTSLCKLVGSNLRPIWWLILMSISCISMHALFNSPIHGHHLPVLSKSLLQSFSDLFYCFFFFLCSPFSGSLVTCFILLFVLIFPLLHFFVLTMDHRRHKLLVALVFFMAIQHVFTIVVVLQQVAIHQHNSTMMMMGALILGGDAPRLLSIWMIEQNRSFTFTQLLGNYTPSLFRQHTRLHRSTFHYLCSIVAPSLVREDTCIRKSISLETRVAISLSCLSTGNTLQMCGEAGLSR